MVQTNQLLECSLSGLSTQASITVMKECIQNVEQEHKPWKPAVTEFLQNYWATPHVTTGVSPFELLHKRAEHLSSHQWFRTAPEHERHYHEKTDKKQGVHCPEKGGEDSAISTEGLCASIEIRACEERDNKIHWSYPESGENWTRHIYLLSDGKKWNASHLALYPETALMPVTEGNEGNEMVASPAWSMRVRRSPAWLKHFERYSD